MSGGTTATTHLLWPIAMSATSTAPTVSLRGEGFFPAGDRTTGQELWKTDGTAGGTALIADLNPGPGNSHPRELTGLGDLVLFRAVVPGSGELWKTDGVIAEAISAVPAAGGPQSVHALCDFKGLLLFAAGTVAGDELWRSDGTVAGTRRLAVFPSQIEQVEVAGDLAFIGTQVPSRLGVPSEELWVSDGTSAGTRLIARFAALGMPGNFTPFAASDDLLFFMASDGSVGPELRVSDGTELGTGVVAQLVPGPTGSSPSELTALHGGVVFSAFTVGRGRELWYSDGTEPNTVLLRDIRPGTESSDPNDLVAIGSRYVFFAADDGVTGRELWVTDGTAAGTRRVADLHPTGDSAPRFMTLSGGHVFFGADDGVLGREPWMLDPGATAQNVGQGCGIPGVRRPTLVADDPVLGTTTGIAVGDVRPGSSVFLLLGAPRAGLRWSGTCYVFIEPATVAVLASAVTSSQEQEFLLPLPNAIALEGARVGLQAVLGHPQSPNEPEVSNGVVWTLSHR